MSKTEQEEMTKRIASQHSQTSFLRSDHLSDKKWYQRINYLNCSIVFGIPALALYGLFTTKIFYWQTIIFAILMYLWSALGITAGYHRMYSHCAFEGNFLLRLWLILGGSSALQGSVKYWCLLHRAHHRWTDTNKDPYNAKRGFWYAHVGWLLLDNIYVTNHINIKDIKSDKLAEWQHKNYQWFGPFMSLIFPSIIAGFLWNDIRGGFYLAGAFRVMLVHHATWCVNSVAHWFGDHTFDDTISPRDHIITGLLTMGEGYHNFHHEFPNDYRNGVHWYDYDPTKWFINLSYYFGFAYNLKRFPRNEVFKGEIDMKQKKLDKLKLNINYGRDINKLPFWTQEYINLQIKNNKILICINDIIHDVTDFVLSGSHPGGKSMIYTRNGKDVTKQFNGEIYNHTNAARNLMSHFRVARLQKNN